MAVSVAALLLTRAVVGFVPTGTHRATGCSQAPRTCTMRCNALLVVAPKLLSSQLHFPSAMHAAPMSMARPSVQSRASLKCALAEERIESVKVGFVSLLSGSVLMAPLALLEPGAFSAQWELAHDMLPLMLGLFGIVYRYAVRSDENDMLKQGVVGAFAITRSLSALQVSSTCSALPLSCGPPFGYFDYAMILQLAVLAVESAVAFGGAAFAIESLFERGWLKRLATKMPVE